MIPRESPSTILTNKCIGGSSGERTSQLVFYVPWGLMERFSRGFLVSINLSGINLENFIKI